jgi:hypothetical protein
MSLDPVPTTDKIGFSLSRLAEMDSERGYVEAEEEPEESLMDDFPDISTGTSTASQAKYPVEVSAAPTLLEKEQLALCKKSKVNMGKMSNIAGGRTVYDDYDDADDDEDEDSGDAMMVDGEGDITMDMD